MIPQVKYQPLHIRAPSASSLAKGQESREPSKEAVLWGLQGLMHVVRALTTHAAWTMASSFVTYANKLAAWQPSTAALGELVAFLVERRRWPYQMPNTQAVHDGTAVCQGPEEPVPDRWGPLSLPEGERPS
eukprot:GHVU01082600.1.p2 GENE.GHVU01082600.1~~GHVU01082600.1.p2  ORF type:complete len:131 (+),score=2.53 GHVU01082600.1:864-1256(+)